jgi:ATP-dependent helicase HrpA
MAVRAERLAANYRRDQSQQALLDALREPLDALLPDVPHALILSLSVRQYWFMLEEFAVSLYAQHLGTSMPVSEKRLRAQWESVERWMLASGGRTPE